MSRKFNADINQKICSQYDLNAYEALACGKGINILVVGDSISALPYMYALKEQLSYDYGVDCSIKNISMSSSKSYAGYVRTNLLEEDFIYDLAIICFGQNDKNDVFPVEYESVIRSILNMNPDCCIISILESSQRTYTEKMQGIIELAEYYNIPIADTIAAFEESEFPYEKLCSDGVHPNEQGQEIYFSLLNRIIAEHVQQCFNQKTLYLQSLVSGKISANESPWEHTSHFRPIPLHSEVSKFDTFTFYSPTDFQRINDTTYEITLDHVSGIPGLYGNRFPDHNDVKIYLNDELLYHLEEDFYHSFMQAMISPLENESRTFDGTLRIEFQDHKHAEAFWGFIIS
ncbi:MAG: SGNH/GDSL hydrolase family protein [Eubacteriales bacterium]|nr:SGNH/GDSL hydrolase family protein [Eubacteriales bacterium]